MKVRHDTFAFKKLKQKEGLLKMGILRQTFRKTFKNSQPLYERLVEKMEDISDWESLNRAIWVCFEVLSLAAEIVQVV